MKEERRKMEVEFDRMQQELIAQHRAAIDRVEKVTSQVKEVEAEKDMALTTLMAMRSDAATAEDKLMEKNHQVELANETLRVKHDQLADIQCDYEDFVRKMKVSNPDVMKEGLILKAPLKGWWAHPTSIPLTFQVMPLRGIHNHHRSRLKGDNSGWERKDQQLRTGGTIKENGRKD